MFGSSDAIRREFPHFLLDYLEDTAYTIHITSNSDAWSGNLYDFYCTIYERLTHDLPPLESSMPVRDAIQEALINALVHANYYDRRGLVIRKLSDEIVISNPGSFRVPVDEAVHGGRSDPRNRAL